MVLIYILSFYHTPLENALLFHTLFFIRLIILVLITVILAEFVTGRRNRFVDGIAGRLGLSLDADRA